MLRGMYRTLYLNIIDELLYKMMKEDLFVYRLKSQSGEADHLIEQLACVYFPLLSSKRFIHMEHRMGDTLEAMVGEKLLITGRKEKQPAIEQGNYHNGVPAITVIKDAGWSKCSHKHW